MSAWTEVASKIQSKGTGRHHAATAFKGRLREVFWEVVMNEAVSGLQRAGVTDPVQKDANGSTLHGITGSRPSISATEGPDGVLAKLFEVPE